MKKLFKLLSYLILLLIILVGTGCIFNKTIRNMVRYNFADINDYKIFDSRPITKSTQIYKYATATNAIDVNTISEVAGNFDNFLETHKTVAFLIIKNDSLVFEKYYNNYKADNIVPSFSMAKSVTSILIGCALQDGFIKSIQEPVSNYLPELKANGFDKVSIEHVLQMTSGLAFNESYFNPFGEAAKFYYGNEINKYTSNLKLNDVPGTKFNYVSGNTQLLGLILTRALKNKTVSDYCTQKLWSQLGMEYDASWSLDNTNGMEKTFCCLNARAKDFAKIGSLYLHNGYWNGHQIVDSNWVKQSTKLYTNNGACTCYSYQWWKPSQNGDYMAHGILGQYIYVNPTKNLVIVRLGSDEANINWGNFFVNLADKY
jgi:CubicO group peptidase (beta-lactamase class C family)